MNKPQDFYFFKNFIKYEKKIIDLYEGKKAKMQSSSRLIVA